MLVSKSFLQFFDKVSSQSSPTVWRVHESDRSATFTELEIKKTNAEFVGFDEYLTKSMACLTTIRSSIFKDKECDGIAFVVHGKQEQLLFVELKSKYSKKLVYDAIKQMCYSFLKMHSMLSLCEDYSLTNLPIIFCAATNCAMDEKEESHIKQYIHQALMSNEYKETGLFLQNLFFKGSVCIKFNNLFQIMNIRLPVHDHIKHKEITVFLNKTKNPKDKTAIFIL